MDFPEPNSHSAPPPSYASSSIPAAGLRVPTVTTSAFPSVDLIGKPPFTDLGGEPVWVGSALMGNSVHPAKVAPHLPGVCRVPFGGAEHEHKGRYDILPLTSDMEWVLTSFGQIPKGRRTVEGGFEENGNHLFHALVTISDNELRVPGKAGEHLKAAHCAYGGREYIQKENYQILCWR